MWLFFFILLLSACFLRSSMWEYVSILSFWIKMWDSVVCLHLFCLSIHSCWTLRYSTLEILGIVLLWTSVQVSLCSCTFSFTLGRYRGVQLLGHVVNLFNFFRNCQNDFPSVCTNLLSHDKLMKVPDFPHLHYYLVFVENFSYENMIKYWIKMGRNLTAEYV